MDDDDNEDGNDGDDNDEDDDDDDDDDDKEDGGAQGGGRTIEDLARMIFHASREKGSPLQLDVSQGNGLTLPKSKDIPPDVVKLAVNGNAGVISDCTFCPDCISERKSCGTKKEKKDLIEYQNRRSDAAVDEFQSLKEVLKDDFEPFVDLAMRFCAVCRSTGDVHRCSGCKAVWYCSSACQRKD